MSLSDINITREKGVYVLVLKCTGEKSVRVGSFGHISIKPGYYYYVGSAFGGGGLSSRIKRHLKTAKKCRWHIDYIRRHMKAYRIYTTTEDVEHKLADRLKACDTEIPMKGFGSSDCSCISHLFYSAEMIDISALECIIV